MTTDSDMHTSENTPAIYNPSLIVSYGNADYVFDNKGRKYIDFTSGIAVNALGHRWDIIGSAVQKQMEKFIHCSNYFTNEPHIQLCKTLVTLANTSCKSVHFKVAYICNSGTEANEAALKFARLAAKYRGGDEEKSEYISCTHAFHGRTMGSLSVTAGEEYKKKFYPLIPNCTVVPYNDSVALERVASAKTAAIIIEPIQGEGGLAELTPSFVDTIMQVRKNHGVFVIVDEVQSGLYRTGTALACEQYDIQPDMITLAKSLGGGLPIGATIISENIASMLSPGDHGSTMGGNPVTCAAANAFLKKISSKLIQLEIATSARHLEKHVQALVQQMNKRHPHCVIHALGKGHLRGITLPSECKVHDIVSQAQKKGLLILRTRGNALRLAPSLLCPYHVLSQGMKILKSVLCECLKSKKTHE